MGGLTWTSPPSRICCTRPPSVTARSRRSPHRTTGGTGTRRTWTLARAGALRTRPRPLPGATWRRSSTSSCRPGESTAVHFFNGMVDPQQGAHMATLRLTGPTTAPPEQFFAALTDFGPGRSKLFGNSADDYLKVHDQGPGHADVTEGSAGIWERLHYDWSDPNHVVLKTTDSNLWGGSSGHTYTLTRKPNGTTDVDVVVVRDGKNFKGRVLGTVLGVFGKGVLGKAFEKPLKAIEARN